MSLDTEAEALKTLIATATKMPAYDLDEVPGTPPANYVEVYLAPRNADNPARSDGLRSTVGRRLSTRVVAKTVSNGRLIEQRITDLFDLSTVTLDGEPVHVAYESGGGNFEYDTGAYTALTDWTYVI